MTDARVTAPQPGEAPARPPLRVAVFGLRGFPNVQGGVERHCEMLYPRLAARGAQVTVLVRSRYAGDPAARASLPVTFVALPSVRASGFEAMLHSLLATGWCIAHRPDVVHVHGIGPALCAPLARLAGLKVIVTLHSFNYEHQKWGRIARAILRLGERMAGRFANRCITISEGMRSSLASRFGIRPALIPNGVEIAEAIRPGPAGRAVLDGFGIPPYRYLVSVGRLVPEKRQPDLIRAWAALSAAERAGWRLVIVGAADHDSPYSAEVRDLAAATPDVVLTGLQTGAALQALWSHAGGFLLPSSHEGLPIAMLEAMSYSLPVLASDITPNLEIGLPAECYVPMGDVAAWSAAMGRLISRASAQLAAGGEPLRIPAFRAEVADKYDWDKVADQTIAVYREVVDPAAGR